ncbi:hypothetical protein, partial [Burkholderia pyrrocinia]|uniref:hypothetical protein n=1 Tax=Burkholderia pyrrocinia TaxID=60550 RepID=UPI002AAF722C
GGEPGTAKESSERSVFAPSVRIGMAARSRLSLKNHNKNALHALLIHRTLSRRNAEQATHIYRVEFRSSPKV